MRIAIQASDLDHLRIDGTRVYLKELLERFGSLAPEEQFLLYHARNFNPVLAPPKLANYREVRAPFPRAWMQTRFAWEIFRKKPEKLFLPIQAAPFFLPKKVEVTATIHDLAFKRYPETFPARARWKLNVLLDVAVRRANKLIAVSESTKRDLLEFFPKLRPEMIHVIHHGFDAEFFGQRISQEELSHFLAVHALQPSCYVLYVGALQPRKNLVRLIAAFEIAKRQYPSMHLVLVGEPAWLSGDIVKAAQISSFKKDIHLIGRVTFEELRMWYQGARLFAFPSLYEGFGIPILEAFASDIPVLTARNSSLPEVAREAALYADAEDAEDLAAKLLELWGNEKLRGELVDRGRERLKNFSWDKCASDTLRYILKK